MVVGARVVMGPNYHSPGLDGRFGIRRDWRLLTAALETCGEEGRRTTLGWSVTYEPDGGTTVAIADAYRPHRLRTTGRRAGVPHLLVERSVPSPEPRANRTATRAARSREVPIPPYERPATFVSRGVRGRPVRLFVSAPRTYHVGSLRVAHET
jgi:hypothetical protein